jgi:CheY-like chemotaxis protein
VWAMKKTVVAIFENDPINRFIYERLLSQRTEDIEFYIFDNPDKGIEMAKTIQFDIVFIEIHFWKSFGGISILQRLKEVSSPLMVSIAMTSLLRNGDIEYVIKEGFTLCVEKSVVLTVADFYKFF